MTTKTMDSESYLANVESADIANSKFIPTKEELEELGFNDGGLYRELDLGKDFKIQAIEYVNVYLIYKPSGFGNCLYPQSLDDIRTLIKILTPQ